MPVDVNQLVWNACNQFWVFLRKIVLECIHEKQSLGINSSSVILANFLYRVIQSQ